MTHSHFIFQNPNLTPFPNSPPSFSPSTPPSLSFPPIQLKTDNYKAAKAADDFELDSDNNEDFLDSADTLATEDEFKRLLFDAQKSRHNMSLHKI